jgi:Phosphatidylinositol 3- and 4-kinase
VIYENHSPVFRYFFVENFLNAETWYAAKMRYTRSVAVSSIVGHILGIGTFQNLVCPNKRFALNTISYIVCNISGDRHMSNILVHHITGEVIHIDFGIVFEQGKVSILKPFLNLHEHVPGAAFLRSLLCSFHSVCESQKSCPSDSQGTW